MTARDRSILMVVGALALLAGFWFLALKPKRAESQALAARITTERQRLETAQQTVAAGEQAKAGYPRDYSVVAELGKAIPADDDLPGLLYQLEATAHGAHVSFRALTRSGGGAATSAPATGATGAASSAAGSSSSTGSSSSSGSASSAGASTTAGSGSTAGAPTAATATSSLPPGAVVGTAGLATLPFSFEFTGSYAQLESLVGDIQRFVREKGDTVAVRGRLLTIDGLSLVPGSNGLSNIQAKLAVTAYLAPQTSAPAATPGATTTTPSTTTTPAPTTSAIAGGGTS